MSTEIVLGTIIKSAILSVILLGVADYMTLAERKVAARIQSRVGPNRAGPGGLLQPIADAIKLLTKEAIIPKNARMPIYVIAPMISVIVAFLTWTVIPLGPPVEIFGQRIEFHIADLNVGVLFLLAATSLGVYGITLGGWASGNKYSLLGAMRSAAQMLSYEISMGLAILSVVLLAGSLSLVDIVNAQRPLWFVVLQPVGFIIYFISGIAETNRAPFDLPEAEQELVAGYLTEYSGMRWAMYFLAEYVGMVTISAVATTLYFGGWDGPFGFAPGIWWFVLKVVFFLFVYLWVRWTLPRMRYDRLMHFGWQILLPVAILNLVVTAIAAVVFWSTR